MILPRYLYISTCSNYLWLKLTQNCGCLPKHITFDLASFTIIWLLAQNVYRPFNCLGKPFGVSENRLRSSAHNKCTNTVLEIHTPTLQSKYCFKSDMHFRKRKPLATPPWLTPISLWIIGLSLELRFTRKSVFVYTFLRVSTTRPFNIWGCMCSTGPSQYRRLKRYIYSSCYYHHQIGSIRLSHCYHIFPLLCAWDVCYIMFCHLLHIHSGETGNLFSLLLCSLWWVQIFGYVLACRSYSFVCTVHHLIIIIVQTSLKALNL